MRNRVEIENIEQMRLREGIDDVELREQVRRLKAGDFVKITLLSGAKTCAGEILLVRITSINGLAFRGKLTKTPASAALSNLRAGSLLAFNAAHIHSVPQSQANCGR